MSSIVSSDKPVSAGLGVVLALVLLVVGGFLFFPALGQTKDIESHGGRHSEIAREMAQSRQYVVPICLGTIYTMKPPLYHWAAAFMYNATGRVDFRSSRLPSALACMVSAVAVFILGCRWFNVRAGFLSGLVYLCFPLIVIWGRHAVMDALMAATITGAILFCALAAGSRRWPAMWSWWTLACLCVAAAILAKGLSAIFFIVIAVPLVWRMERGRWLPPWPLLLAGLALAGVLVAAWYHAADQVNPGHTRKMLFDYQIEEGMNLHPGDVAVYVEELFLKAFPWCLFIPGAAWATFVAFRKSKWTAVAIPALILGIAVALMTCLPNRRDHYLLPVMPMLALFLGGFLEWAARRDNDTEELRADWRWQRLFLWPLIVALAITGIAVLGVVGFWIWRGLHGLPVVLALAAIVIGAAIWGVASLCRREYGLAVGSLTVGCLVVAMSAYPIQAKYYWEPNPYAVVAQTVQHMIPPGTRIGAFEVERDESFFFLLNRPIEFCLSPAAMNAFLKGSGTRYLLVHSENTEATLKQANRALTVVNDWTLRKKSRITLLKTAD